MARTTQPYRASGRRHESPALAAMQRGGPRFMRSPGDVRRQAMKRKRKRKGRARYSGSLQKVLRRRRQVRR